MIIYRIKFILLSSVLLSCISVNYAQEVELASLSILNQQPTFSRNLKPSSSFPALNSNSIVLPGISVYNKYKISELHSNALTGNNVYNADDDNAGHNMLGMFILAGYGKLRYNFEGSPLYQFDYTFSKGGGVSFEIPLLKLNDKFSVYNDLGFSLFKAYSFQRNSDTAGSDPQNNYTDITLTFAPNTISVSTLVKYTLTPGNFKYYVALGIYNSFVVSSTNIKETVHVTNGESVKYAEEAVPEVAVYGLMLLASTGFSYKNIGLEVRFDPGRSYSNKLNYAVFMPNIQALLHVTFNRK
jgi:hypothetical protein